MVYKHLFRLYLWFVIFTLTIFVNGQLQAYSSMPAKNSCQYDANTISTLIFFGDSLSDDGQGGTGRSLSTWTLIRALSGKENIFQLTPYIRTYLTENLHIPPIFTQDLAKQGLLFAKCIISMIDIGDIPPWPYYKGRFSDGPVWPEYLRTMMSIPENKSMNFAHGGSWTLCFDDKNNALVDLGKLSEVKLSSRLPHLSLGTLIPPCLNLQIKTNLLGTQTESGQSQVPPNSIAFILSGANDYISGIENTDIVVTEQAKAIDYLIERGVSHVVWFKLPDITIAPKYNNTDPMDKQKIADIIQRHNNNIDVIASTFQARYPQVQLIVFDLWEVQNNLHANLELDYPFANVVNSCLQGENGNASLATSQFRQYTSNQAFNHSNNHLSTDIKSICAAPENYYFWDELHPTTTVHYYIAKILCQFLDMQGIHCNPNQVLSPSSIINRNLDSFAASL